MATISHFKPPTVQNEPNVRLTPCRSVVEADGEQKHYTKGSADRQALEAALEALTKKAPIEVPAVVAGKQVQQVSFSCR